VARRLIAIKRDLREERKARERGQARPELWRRVYGRSGGRKGGGRKEKEAPTGGTDMSVAQEKKGSADVGRCGKGKVGRWATGPKGKVR
jgi:hypothetical protein